MNSKIFLLTVAVAAVGLFAMPNSLSLFAGQHTFDNGTSVRCEKCHQDIYDEMSSASGQYGISTAHVNTPALKECKGCHRTGTIDSIPIAKFSNGTRDYSGNFSQNVAEKGAHAAVTMECAGCHTGVPGELLNVNEAHGPFYNESVTNTSALAGAKNNGTILKGANEACVGCHTHTNINATWRRSVGMDLLVYENTSGLYTIHISANNSYNETHTKGGNVTADGTNP
ncbi:MAG: hypothetical protein OIN66_15660 [Candidatus Methanoperedens sp.]|nr:hypothetical protein [Candidatus Methanoperedens sp.]